MTVGLAVITGTEDRQHAYVALSRGTEINLAYVFTASPKTADPAPSPRPAPELARYDRRAAGPDGPPASAATPGEALTVLAGVLDRDGQQQTATQSRNQALTDLDHLAVLHAIWTAETTPARDQAYRDLLINNLPPGYHRPPGTRRSGCSGRCVPPNWPAWTRPASWPTRSPNGIWPDLATSPPSSTPACGTASVHQSRSR